MGLDIEIRKIKKPHLEAGKVYNEADIDGIWVKDKYKNESEVMQAIPYAMPVMVRTEHVDIKKIRLDYGLTDEAYVYDYLEREVVVFDYETEREVKIAADIVKRQYTYEETELAHVCDYECIRSWRNAEDISCWFHDNIECEIENTGMYLLSDEVIFAFNEAFPEYAIQMEEIDSERPLFYWEWY